MLSTLPPVLRAERGAAIIEQVEFDIATAPFGLLFGFVTVLQGSAMWRRTSAG